MSIAHLFFEVRSEPVSYLPGLLRSCPHALSAKPHRMIFIADTRLVILIRVAIRISNHRMSVDWTGKTPWASLRSCSSDS